MVEVCCDHEWPPNLDRAVNQLGSVSEGTVFHAEEDLKRRRVVPIFGLFDSLLVQLAPAGHDVVQTVRVEVRYSEDVVEPHLRVELDARERLRVGGSRCCQNDDGGEARSGHDLSPTDAIDRCCACTVTGRREGTLKRRRLRRRLIPSPPPAGSPARAQLMTPKVSARDSQDITRARISMPSSGRRNTISSDVRVGVPPRHGTRPAVDAERHGNVRTSPLRLSPRIVHWIGSVPWTQTCSTPVARLLLEAVDVLPNDATTRPTGFLRPNSKRSRLLRTQPDHRL